MMVKEVGGAKIGVVSGRYYAMDRDKNWNREQLAYDALVYGTTNSSVTPSS